MIKSVSSTFSLPSDKYPINPTKTKKKKSAKNDLEKTFLNLHKLGFLTVEATLKKLVKQLYEKIAIPKFSKNDL